LCVFSSSLSETDVAFDVGESWYTSAPAYASSSISFQLVALHEFGHSLGLLHENGVLDTMNAYYANGGPIGYTRVSTPPPNAPAGVRFLHPESGSTVRGAAITAFQPTGARSSALLPQPVAP